MKKNIFISMSIIFILSVSGCAINTGTKIYDNEKMIAKNYNSFNLVQSKQSVADNCLSGSAESLEGMGTIWKFKASDHEDVNITYKLKVSSGKAKLVLISQNDTLTTLVECTPDSETKQETTITIPVEKGQNRIKLVGAKDTKIEFEISADKGKIMSF